MKEYKSNKKLIEQLKSKNLVIDDETKALNIIDTYSYYSVINTYKQYLKIQMENILIVFLFQIFIFYIILIKI
jgi:abortive infection bacteriophage resistance protein